MKQNEPSAPPPDAPAAKLSEAEFLAQQAHNAQLAMSKALAEFKTRLGQGADPRAWAKEFPWITVGAAAVAGFVTATALIPSKEEQALKKLARIEQALNPPRRESGNGDGEKKKEGGGFVGTLLHEALAMARPLLISLVSGGLGGVAASGLEPDPGQTPPDASPDEAQSYGGA